MEGCKCTDTEFCMHVCRNLGGCKRFEYLKIEKKKPMEIKWHEEKEKEQINELERLAELGRAVEWALSTTSGVTIYRNSAGIYCIEDGNWVSCNSLLNRYRQFAKQ